LRKNKMAAVCLLAAFIFIGCWDQQPINRLSIVFGLGFDPGSEGGKSIRLIVGSPVFNEDANSTRVTKEAEGRTFGEALRTLQRRSNARLVLGKVKIVLFNAEMAKEGIDAVLHQLDHDFQFNSRAFLLVTENKAADIFHFRLGETERISTYIEEMLFSSAERVSAVPPVRFTDFLIKLESRHDHGYIPLVTIKEEEGELHLTGLAVFRQGRMVGTYNLNETVAVMLVCGELWNKGHTFEMEGYGGDIVSVRIMGGGAASKWCSLVPGRK
jgi:Ger(x)C family germination protein